MTKTAKRIVSDPAQMSLLDLLKQDLQERRSTDTGRLCVSAKMQEAVRRSLKKAPKSRETIADEISHMSGQDVTVHMINSWAAESHPHRLPAELIPAFCAATDCDAVLMVANDALGKHVLPAPDVVRADIQHRAEQIRELQKEQQKYTLFLKELEGES